MSELPASRKMRHYAAMTDPIQAPLSHKFDLARLGTAPQRIEVVADEAARAGIAASFGIPAIASLRGDFVLALARAAGGDDRVTATLTLAATVTQICVVSLEKFEQTIGERATLVMLTEAQAAALDLDSAPIDPDEPDEIVATGTVVDLGVVLTEQLALALDPYPRRPGSVVAVEHAAVPAGKFESLAALLASRRGETQG